MKPVALVPIVSLLFFLLLPDCPLEGQSLLVDSNSCHWQVSAGSWRTDAAGTLYQADADETMAVITCPVERQELGERRILSVVDYP
jgi:hypothetical protein